VLIKFLDAEQDLSIQVHPNDQLAKERHNSNGKTEMWYIMDAEEDAKLIIGFNHDVTRKEFLDNLNGNSLQTILHYEGVKEGDAFFINTGKIHAIGAGVLLAEIQQTSDITYRVYDFNRRDQNGNLRELHTELALDAMDYKQKQDFKLHYGMQPDTVNLMVESPYFRTGCLDLTQNFTPDISERDSFTIYMCVAGSASVDNEVDSVPIRKGETLLVPAHSASVQISTTGAKLLEITI
jgi:mannose-6-phosphate isomerase